MNIRESSAKSTLIQIVIFLIMIADLIFWKKDTLTYLFTSGEISKTGLVINGTIIVLFLLGMFRIVITLFRYINEYQILIKLIEYLKENTQNPASQLAEDSMAVQRYNAVKWVAQQGAPVNQAAMAASLNATENAHLTVIRFVHSTLILAGVFGTVVSLSMALIGAAGLLNSPEGVKEMGVIISGMSSALSSTVTAIICFFIFAYFYLRLNNARIQVLTYIEDMTSLYLLPGVMQTETDMAHQVSSLTSALKEATDKLIIVEQTFIGAGERLQQVVKDLQGKVNTESMDNNLTEIKELLRKGFHLSEPEYDVIQGIQKEEIGSKKTPKESVKLETPTATDLPKPQLDVK